MQGICLNIHFLRDYIIINIIITIIITFQVKDVRVPENLQRAMAAEAEAAREARAKVDPR